MKKVSMVSVLSLISILFASAVLAEAPPSGTIGYLAYQATASASGIIGLMLAICYIAGLGFVIGGIVKLKAHKDTPTQVPISTGIVWMILGILLLFLPTFISSLGKTALGGSAQMVDYTGKTINIDTGATK